MLLSLLTLTATGLWAQTPPNELAPRETPTEYATALLPFGEGPLLSSIGSGGYAVRCTIDSVRGNATMVRLVVAGDRGVVVSRRIDKKSAFVLGKLRDAVTATLDARALKTVEAKLDLRALQALPANDAFSGGRDGATWILEVAREGAHHAVVRSSPDLDARQRGTERVVDACAALFTAAGTPLPR